MCTPGCIKCNQFQLNIHVPSGTHARDPSNQAAAGLRLRPRGHRNWLGQHKRQFSSGILCSHMENSSDAVYVFYFQGNFIYYAHVSNVLTGSLYYVMK
jgi:hypothetical protein